MHSYKPYAYIERQRQRLPAIKNLNTIHKLNIPPSIITNVTVLLPMLTKRRGQSLRCDVTIHTIGREGEHSPFSSVKRTRYEKVECVCTQYCIPSKSARPIYPLYILIPTVCEDEESSLQTFSLCFYLPHTPNYSPTTADCFIFLLPRPLLLCLPSPVSL